MIGKVLDVVSVEAWLKSSCSSPEQGSMECESSKPWKEHSFYVTDLVVGLCHI